MLSNNARPNDQQGKGESFSLFSYWSLLFPVSEQQESVSLNPSRAMPLIASTAGAQDSKVKRLLTADGLSHLQIPTCRDPRN